MRCTGRSRRGLTRDEPARRCSTSTRATRSDRPLAGLDAPPLGSRIRPTAQADRDLNVARSTGPAISAATHEARRRAMGLDHRAVARRRAPVPLARTASFCAEVMAMAERSISRCSCAAAQADRAYRPGGRGHRLRGLHPQDRGRAEALPGVVERAAQFHQSPSRGRLARTTTSRPADVIAALEDHRLSRRIRFGRERAETDEAARRRAGC